MKLLTLSFLLLLSPAVADSSRRKRLNEPVQLIEDGSVVETNNEVGIFHSPERQTEAEDVSMFTGRSAAVIRSNMGCAKGKRKIKMEINLDRWGDETTWEVKRKSDGRVIMSNSRTYKKKSENGGQLDSETQSKCVDSGEKYELTLYDKIGDGICCKFDDGSYTLSIEEDGGWTPLVHGGNFKAKQHTHLIQVLQRTVPLSGRDEQWLVAHNTRRQYWHSYYNQSYVPLKWSAELAESSRIYAEKLLDTCNDVSIEHDPDNTYGENMAKNRGSQGWGRLYTADKITARFIDREVTMGYPKNYHMTQALWRATHYVGCADTVKDWRRGRCRIQVCRYSKAGNCDIDRYTWETKMMNEHSFCAPDCPPEGCF